MWIFQEITVFLVLKSIRFGIQSSALDKTGSGFGHEALIYREMYEVFLIILNKV